MGALGCVYEEKKAIVSLDKLSYIAYNHIQELKSEI